MFLGVKEKVFLEKVASGRVFWVAHFEIYMISNPHGPPCGFESAWGCIGIRPAKYTHPLWEIRGGAYMGV